jgi:hypothetical protein
MLLWNGSWPPARESELIKSAVNRGHTLGVTVPGGRMVTTVDGRQAEEYIDRKEAFRSGAIALVCCGDSTMQFRPLEIKELPE